MMTIPSRCEDAHKLCHVPRSHAPLFHCLAIAFAYIDIFVLSSNSIEFRCLNV